MVQFVTDVKLKLLIWKEEKKLHIFGFNMVSGTAGFFIICFVW